MSSNIATYLLSALLVLHLVEGKPVSSLQSLKQLLEEESRAPYPGSEEKLAQVKELESEDADLGARGAAPWEPSAGNSALAEKDSGLLARLLGDLLSTSKRSWSRFKKGGLRSCFGVRLERIGSFSGLGC
ncbi:natriuretic peptide A-like [Scleropages formosus]|uniref:Natriuretic peptide A-like n=1 Tax=Scleropages formosus TaxID=113540 RepID=A0A8C9RGJ6_SCLFO|nr:C-type natriuretic peptide 3-like [Scleropages formosus]